MKDSKIEFFAPNPAIRDSFFQIMEDYADGNEVNIDELLYLFTVTLTTLQFLVQDRRVFDLLMDRNYLIEDVATYERETLSILAAWIEYACNTGITKKHAVALHRMVMRVPNEFLK